MENKVYPFKPRLVHRPKPATTTESAFDDLTEALVMARARAGTLDPAIVAALLAAVRQPAGEAGR